MHSADGHRWLAGAIDGAMHSGHGHGYLLAAEELQSLAGLLQGWTAILINSRLLHDS
jgi:uncharacterized phosphosugar-binding protein